MLFKKTITIIITVIGLLILVVSMAIGAVMLYTGITTGARSLIYIGILLTLGPLANIGIYVLREKLGLPPSDL